MKLSAEEISQIKAWISKKGFTHTDVQFEIIDHVASAIEEIKVQNPEMSLEAAFNKVRESFGPLGFLTFEESIQKRYNSKLMKSYILAAKSFLMSPKLIILGLTLALLYLISNRFSQYFNLVIQSILISYAILSMGYSFYLFRTKKHLKNYLSFNMLAGMPPLLASTIFNLRIIFKDLLTQNWSIVIVGILIVFLYAINKGCMKMVTETEKLHKIYQ